MTSSGDQHDHRERVKTLLEAALALPPLERAAALHRDAPGEPEVHREVLELARAADRADGGFLSPLVQRPADAPPALALGSDRIGPYRLIRLLGRGAMGAVYEAAQDIPIARRVAVKVLSSLMDPQVVARRFEFERDALARLDHPGIAKILDAGITDLGHPYLVMELVDGMPLTEFCASHTLGIAQRLRLVASIAQAVHHAHGRGILHRDLKPQNILATAASGAATAKIIDFGVAKLLGDRHAAGSIGTLAGQVFGTPGYMAPEQLAATPSAVDARADVFALGVVLYELLTGVLPSAAGPRTPPSKVGLRAPLAAREDGPQPSHAELDCIVLKSIEHDRELRYPSAQHLADDLHRLLTGLPIAARPPSTLYLARKFAARHRLSVALAAVALALLVATVVSTTLALVREQQARRVIAKKQIDTEAARHEADTLSSVLSSIIASVDPAVDGPGVPLRTVLDRTADHALARAAQTPAADARLRLTLAKSYESLGQYPRALELLTPPLADTGPLPDDLRIDLLLAQARNQIAMSRPQPALDALSKARSRLAAPRAGDSRAWAIDVNRANALQLLGQREDARTLYETLLAQADADPASIPTTDRARVLINLGVLMHQLGHRDEGEAKVLAGRDAVRAALGADHPLAITAEHNFAVLRMARGDTAGAIDAFEAVIAQWTRLAGPTHTNTLNARLQLADLYRRAKRLDDAAAILATLPAQLDAALGPDHTLAIGAVQSQAELAAARADWPVAIERMQECLRRYEARRGDDDPNTWYARAMLVDIQRQAALAATPAPGTAQARDWRGELDRLLTSAEARFGQADRYVRAIRRLRDAAPAAAPP